MIGSQKLECIVRGGDDGGLELRDGVILHPGRVGQVARHATDGGGEPGVGVELHFDCSGFSLHVG